MFLLKDIPLRIIDFIGHCTFALILPGKWFWQFIPDMFIPFCIGYSVWVYGYNPIMPVEKISGGSLFLKMHQLFHTIYLPVIVIALFGWQAGLQCLVHIAWDQVTHREGWQRKSLWRV